MKPETRATKKQQILLGFVADFIKVHDYGPSYREIMTALGYKSVSTVAVHVEGLIQKGYLERTDGSARSLAVVSSHKKESPALQELQAIREKLDEKDREIIDKTIAILNAR